MIESIFYKMLCFFLAYIFAFIVVGLIIFNISCLVYLLWEKFND